MNFDEYQTLLFGDEDKKKLENFVKGFTDEVRFDVFSLLFRPNIDAPRQLLSEILEDKSDWELEVAVPSITMCLIQDLADSSYGGKVLEMLEDGYRSKLSSRVRFPLKFATDGLKDYLFSGEMLKDIKEKKPRDLIVNTGEEPTRPFLLEILKSSDITKTRSVFYGVNKYSKFYVTWDMVMAVWAVLRSQVREEVNTYVGKTFT